MSIKHPQKVASASPSMVSIVLSEAKLLLQDVSRVYITLLKVMVPALLIVKALDTFGGTQFLASLLAPFMDLVGLPEQMGLVWATVILTNIYTGMAVFFDMAVAQTLSVAQVSVLGVMMLIAHSLPIEGAVAKMAGVSWRITVPLRIGGGLVFGMIVHQVYELGGWQQQPAVLAWQPSLSTTNLADWAVTQLTMLFSIFFIIMALMLLLKLLRWCGIEKVIQLILSPFLRALTISKEATNVCVIGLTLGLTFGAGLLIAEAKAGHIKKRDVLLAVCFLGLAHSLIEDTILILLLGTDLMAVLWGRIVFAFIVIAIIARFIKTKDEVKRTTKINRH